MLKEERKVGPKGQVVIPKPFRGAMKLHEGSTVTFEYTDSGELKIAKIGTKTEEVFGEVASSGRPFRGKIDPHAAHDEQLKERLG